MVNIYNSLRDEYDNFINGRTKLFIKSTKDDGTINDYIRGLAFTPEGNGTMFIVDDWLIDQLDKLQFIDGVLSVKNGETLTPPVKTEKELQREALLKQLAELDSQPDEEVNVDG